MENEIVSEDSQIEEIIKKIANLALSHEEASISNLKELLSSDEAFFSPFVQVSRLAARALLQKGKIGVEILKNSILEASSYDKDKLDVGGMLESLWYGAHGELPPKSILLDVDLLPPLNNYPTSDVIESAKQALHEIVDESRFSENLFEKLLVFLFIAILSVTNFKDEIDPEERKVAIDFLRSVVFELFAEPAIKITRRLIAEFENLVSKNSNEEEYQRFLTKHPVFIDPLASEVIPKQKLGLEHITDFVVRRLDNEYILVEIEKPQDGIFTSGNDLTAKFTHAYGQVLDFQEWVDAHGEYARSIMPGIFSPRGILVIGMRNDLTPEQIAKLKRFSINSRSIDVYTYDDLIKKSKDLYENIYK